MKNLKIAAAMFASAALLAGCDLIESVGTTPTVTIAALSDTFDAQGEANVSVMLSSIALEEVTVSLTATGDAAAAVTMDKIVKIGLGSKSQALTVKVDLAQIKADTKVTIAIQSAVGATVGSPKEVSIAVKAGAASEDPAVVSIESDDQFAADATAKLTLKLNKALSTDVSVELAVNSSEDYSTIPAEALTFENPVVIKAGQTKAEVKVILDPATLVSGDNYALISVKSVSGNASAAKDAEAQILYTKAVTENLRSDWKVEFSGEYEEDGQVFHGITVSGVSDTQSYYLYVLEKGTIAGSFDSYGDFLQYVETYIVGPSLGTENAPRIKVGPETWLYYKLPVGGYEVVLVGCSESGHLTGDYATTQFDIEPSEEMKAVYEKYLGEWLLNNPRLTWTISQKVYGYSYTITGLEGLDFEVEAYLNDDLQLEIYSQEAVAENYIVTDSKGVDHTCTVGLYGLDDEDGYFWTGEYLIAYGELDEDGNIYLAPGKVANQEKEYTLGTMLFIAIENVEDGGAWSLSRAYNDLPNYLINPANIEVEETPVVDAAFEDFCGYWNFGGYGIDIYAGEEENTYVFSFGEGYEAAAKYEDGKLTLYDQTFAPFEHNSYGACTMILGGIFSYNNAEYFYYFSNNGGNFDSITKIFTAELHESGNITLVPGECEYGEYVGFRVRWIIINESSDYYGQGNSITETIYFSDIVKPIEEEETDEPAAISLRKANSRRVEAEKVLKARKAYRPYGVIDIL